MARRDRLVKLVLVIACITAIATSAPQPIELEGSARRDLDEEIVHATVVFSDAASLEAQAMQIQLRWSGTRPVTIVPDDPARDPFSVTSFHTLDVLELCMEAGPCELGFSIDPGEGGNRGSLEITGIASRTPDASLCFPDNREFSDAATIEVVFDLP
jgi:hypothetical protein